MAHAAMLGGMAYGTESAGAAHAMSQSAGGVHDCPHGALTARVLGPVPDMARARSILAAERPDCALLDVNLKGQFVFELAEELRARGVPAIFATGYDVSVLPPSRCR